MTPPRVNPFRTARLDALSYRLDADGWDALLTRFDALGRRGLLVGPEGSGKSTLLREIAVRFETLGFRLRWLRMQRDSGAPRCTEWHAVLDRIGPRDILAIDGAEQLSAWRRWTLLRLARRAGGIVGTSHQAGWLPTLRRHETSLALLSELVEELVGAPAARGLRSEGERLFTECAGNLRDCLLGLYDHWSRSALKPSPQAPGSPRFPGVPVPGHGLPRRPGAAG